MDQDWNRESQIDAIQHVTAGDWFITKDPINMSKRERDELFQSLEALLQLQKLPTSYGLPRLAHADEFMLMHTSTDGSVGFKHIASRNYVFLCPKYRAEEYELHVPETNEPFLRGHFDA